MANKIEKMNLMRRNILIGVLIGCGVLFSWFMHPSFISIKYAELYKPILQGAGILGFLLFMFFIMRFWLYKKSLKKDPSVSAAVNDERVNLNWLKAYRFSFYCIIIILIIWKVYETFYFPFFPFALPHGPWLALFVAVMSLVGSFLFYNRGIQDE